MKSIIKALRIILLVIAVFAMTTLANSTTSRDVVSFTIPSGYRNSAYGLCKECVINMDSLMEYNPSLKNRGLYVGDSYALPADQVDIEMLKEKGFSPVLHADHTLQLDNSIQGNTNIGETATPENKSAAPVLRAVVSQGYKYGYIDETGREVIPLIYDEATNFYNGHAIVKRGDQYYLIDHEGKISKDITQLMGNSIHRCVIYNPLDWSLRVKLGNAVFEDDPFEDYLSYDSLGNVFVTRLTLPAKHVRNKYSHLFTNNLRYYSLKKVLRPASSPKDVEVAKRICGVYDSVGNLKFSHKPNVLGFDYGCDLHPFSCGRALVFDLKKMSRPGIYKTVCNFVDETGKKISTVDYDYASDFSDGLACVHKGGKAGYIDVSGNVVIPFIFDGEETIITDIREGGIDTAYGTRFYDIYPNSIYDLDIYKEGQFYDGLAIQKINGCYVVIDKRGEIVNPLKEFKGYIMPVKYFTNGIIVFYDKPFKDDSNAAIEISAGNTACAYVIGGEYLVPTGKYGYIGPFIKISPN